MSYTVQMSTLGAKDEHKVDTWEAGLAMVAELLKTIRAKGYKTVWVTKWHDQISGGVMAHPTTGQTVGICISAMAKADPTDPLVHDYSGVDFNKAQRGAS